jgi:hypothetical protein
MNLKKLQACYADNLQATGESTLRPFPAPPVESHSPADFVSLLIERAAQHDVRGTHPFLRNLVAGAYGLPQLRRWVRLNYLCVVSEIRRHALVAACASDCDLLRSLLAYVGVEADADPVGGTYFSLPQLWVKFGIALGLARTQITEPNPLPDLVELEQQQLADTHRLKDIPVSFLVRSMLDPALSGMVGKRMREQLGLPGDSLDYFWAVQANRWGDDAGRSILESWSQTAEGQRTVWNRYAAEAVSAQEQTRLTILQQAIESEPHL